ncbi:hypothetical protein GE09DRAFT_1219230 [Coniochaeta sp. 2T2.1]|nr:hypothetical protein GE09DRAFT_1219230 [Coniochaeta sp. 2T2.1]
MEAVGAAASIAGLLGLVGQSIDGLVKLRRFFIFAKDAPAKLKELIEDIAALRDTLDQTQKVLKGLQDDYLYPTHLHRELLDELIASVTLCERDVTAWDKNARDSNTGTWKGVKAFFRKAKLAADKDWFDELREKIAGHQRRVSLSLSVLGRTMDHLGLTKLSELNTNIKDLKDAQEKLTEAVRDPAPVSQTLLEFQDTLLSMNESSQETKEQMKQIAKSISTIETAVTRMTSATFHTFPSAVSSVSPGHAPKLTDLIRQDTEDFDSSHRVRRGRTGPLSALQRERAALIRKLGSCSDCKRKRVACQPSHHRMTWEDAVRKFCPAPQDHGTRNDVVTQSTSGIPLSADAMVSVEVSLGDEYEWTCDTMSGIDEAFVEDRCIFCNESFRDVSSDWRGRHLVDRHRFGQCPDDVSYGEGDIPLFRDHLERFHQCSGYGPSNMLVQQFSRLKVSRPTEHPTPLDQYYYAHAVHRNEERSETETLLQTRLDQARNSAVAMAGVVCRSFADGHVPQRVVLSYIEHAGLSLTETISEEVRICREAACIQEEMVVCGHDHLLPRRRPPDDLPLVDYLEKLRRQKEELQGLAETSNPLVLSLPDQLSDFRAHAETGIGEGSESKTLPGSRLSRMLERFNLPAKRPRPRTAELASPEPFTVRDARRSDCRNAKDTIRWWLRGFFKQSYTLRTLLRISTTKYWPPSTTAEEWTKSFLDVCERASIEGSVDEDGAVVESDGAVDSRDTLSHHASSLPASSAAKQKGGSVENLRKDLSRKRLPDWSELGASEKKRARRGG